MAAQGRDARALANATVAAIGPGTAAALAERGVIADVVPERFVAEALVEALDRRSTCAAGRCSSPAPPRPATCSRRRSPTAARGSTSSRSTRPSASPPTRRRSRRRRTADYVTFTSSSTVRNLLEALGDRFPRSARVVSIGPVTSATARELGLEVAVEAERHDPAGVVEALVADAGGAEE